MLVLEFKISNIRLSCSILIKSPKLYTIITNFDSREICSLQKEEYMNPPSRYEKIFGINIERKSLLDTLEKGEQPY